MLFISKKMLRYIYVELNSFNLCSVKQQPCSGEKTATDRPHLAEKWVERRRRLSLGKQFGEKDAGNSVQIRKT